MDNFCVNTSQNVSINYNLASIGDRIAAFLIDSLLAGIYLIGIFSFFAGVFRDMFNNSSAAVIAFILYLPVMSFHLLFELFDNGRSPGKRIMKIQVIKLDGSQPTVGTYLLRWLFRIIDVMFTSGAVAIILIVSGGKGQRLGDMVAGTTVISNKNKTAQAMSFFDPFTDDYVPVFPGIATLTQEQVMTLRNTYMQARKAGNVQVMEKVADTIVNLTHIKRPIELTADAFIFKVISEYYFIAKQA